jgi:phosphoglycolate phosphatase-like HAD superfamily hydrolase
MRRLFVFDLHGTLLQGNEHAVLESSNLSLKKHGKKERFSYEDVKRLQGKPWADFFRELYPSAPEEEIASLIECAKSHAETLIPKYVKPTKHAKEVLEEIKKKGDTILILSSTTPEALAKYLECIGIAHLVDDRIGITEKEEKLGGLNVAELKAKKLCWYLKDKNFDKIILVGDTPDDVKAGKVVGAITFYYNQTGDNYSLADYSISDLKEMLKLIE